MDQLDFLKNEIIFLNEFQHVGTRFKLKKLVILFKRLPQEIDTKSLRNHLLDFICKAFEKNSYTGYEFIKIAEFSIFQLKTSINEDRVCEFIAYLCEIHFPILELYYKHTISYEIGNFFSKKWKYYALKKNPTIDDLIYYYYCCFFLQYKTEKRNVRDYILNINSNDYFKSDLGFYIRKSVIIWICDNCLTNNNERKFFLSEYQADKTILNKLNSLKEKENI